MNIFYIPDIREGMVKLDETESGHAVRVLRMQVGDSLLITDGQGSWYDGVIAVANPRGCAVNVSRSSRDPEKRMYWLTVAVAPTKNADRMEWFTEKSTEIGIDRIVPILCRYSERKHIQLQRLEKIAVAAMKQSQKAWLPEIADMIPFNELITQSFEGKKVIAHCYPGDKPHLATVIKPGDAVLVLIGPEGDFSPEEVNAARAAGFMEVSLGQSRLRTETAALVACHSVALVNQIF
jgi:16S rRNA (uracil1498-N3)-methyltransferase